MSSGLLLFVLFSTTLGLAMIAFHAAQTRRVRRDLVYERMTRDLPGELGLSEPGPAILQLPLVRLLRARLIVAGVQPAPWHVPASVLVLAGCSLFGASRYGLGGAIGSLALLASGFFIATGWAAGRRSDLMLDQLPTFLDHVLRAVEAGGSVQQGLRVATDETQEPLRGVFERVNRKVQLGADLDSALRQLEILDLRELGMIALTIRVNQRYGGPIRDLLRSVVASIRERDRGRRELRALTGETRLSAWVLGLLPTSLAAYISVVNPNYLDVMLNDPSGRRLLMGALAMQVVGSLILWRMVKSV